MLLVTLLGCGDVDDSDREVADHSPGSIRGQQCTDAMVYTNLYDEDGKILDVRKAYGDADGQWILTNLPGERGYTVTAQAGTDVLWVQETFVHYREEVVLDDPTCAGQTD